MKKTITSLLIMLLVVASTWGQSSGTCGDNAYWTLDSDGVLTIGGTGAMWDYTFNNVVVNSPWWNVKDNIKNVVVGEGITTIGNLAFYFCSALKAATLPASITTIGNYAFQKSALESIDLSGCTGLTTIGNSTFRGCSVLKSLSLSASITTIENSAFQDCNSLATITSLATVPPTLGTDVFANVDKSIPVIVPVGTVDAHKAADGWKEFTNISDGATGIVGTLGDNGFVVDGNNIVLKEVQQVTVYNLAGALIYHGYTDSITIDEAGMYIVKIASGAMKIVIR